MGDIMRPVPFTELLVRIFGEFKERKSIFDIPQQQFYKNEGNPDFAVWDEQCDTPVGPAAGPHTQLAQNIVTCWLAGGRFMELKTVQKLDTLEIAKPCIDAEDECFNTEWSTEFTLPKAYDEYLKAWFVLHLLECVFQGKTITQEKSFVFNMSVGYDLAGIKTAPMQEYIDNMMNCADHPKYHQYCTELEAFIRTSPLLDAIPGLQRERLETLSDHISTNLAKGVTLSTMHGCPPHEIETICRYMIEERRINTFVKLNPTLLGYSRVRQILNQIGFDYVQLSEEAFSHDLQMADAKAMLHRLVSLGKECQIGFGVKLTNTLGTINHKHRLSDKEMYMSGRALFPLSVHVTLELSREFAGHLPISYSGGANKFNIREIFETGIRPITMATELLKPGGYLRLSDCVKQIENSVDWDKTSIDLDKLEVLAQKSLTADYTQKEWRGPQDIAVNKSVPLTDCSIAPCVHACPISQDIPEYIRLVGEQKYSQALELIYQRNALPSITGHICDHRCQYNCTRRDYEGAINIREMKKIALKKGWEEYKAKWSRSEFDLSKSPVAIIGAGPAGLSAGYFLARSGHPVTIFEKEQTAGGVVQNIIPQFRIPREAIEHDIQFIQDHGVQIEYGVNSDIDITALKNSGFKYICLGIGADKGNAFTLAGNNQNQYKSLEFLRRFNDGAISSLGKHVVVVGAGNTAMDSARAALKVDGVERVTVMYRRTAAEMPAYKEEYDEAVLDGVEFMFLTNPERFDDNGTLTARKMILGEPDSNNRRKPVATHETVEIDVDAVITAVGEQANIDLLKHIGIPMGDDGWPVVDPDTGETRLEDVFLLGDVNTGPSSIVSAIEGGRKASKTILEREKLSSQIKINRSSVDRAELYQRKGTIEVEMISVDTLQESQYDQFVEQESARCLECSYVCSKCVDVCPNRANIALPVSGFKEPTQVIHLDAYCNECGNCAQFCPWDSKPYKDKFTVFSLLDDFHTSTNQGFFVSGKDVMVRAKGQTLSVTLDDNDHLTMPDELSEEATIIQYVIDHQHYLLGRVEL